jgi:diguanylate cyclase (GGDEF)-like protein
VITSIKRHIELGESGALAHRTDALRLALACIARNAERVLPGVKRSLPQALVDFSNNLDNASDPASVKQATSIAETSIAKWADSVAENLQEKTLTVKEMMLEMAALAETLAQSDTQNSARLGELTSRLQAIGRFDEIGAIRRHISESTLYLKASIRRMEEESQTTVRKLQRQVEIYREQISQSDRRASTDALTTLRNRRGLELAFESRRSRKAPFWLIFIDLNGFKAINDTHGHLAGDEILRLFAKELSAQFESSDAVGRWGGDEFIVMTNRSGDRIDECISRIRHWVLGIYKVQVNGQPMQVRVNAAIGAASWDLREDLQELMARGDALLYEDKRKSA